MNHFLLKSSPKVKVKICGLTQEEHIEFAVSMGTDSIGFVFVENSPRFIQLEDAKRLQLKIPNEITTVAVLQNPYTLDPFIGWNGLIQLCGNEDEHFVSHSPCPVIKSVQWERNEVLRWDGADNVAGILVDGSSGGLGKTFDVKELATLIPSMKTPVIIAGGLNAENVQKVIQLSQPFAVDVSSGVESSLGKKENKKIAEFITSAKKALTK
mgnify:CR=1 FL=1|tara:strand:- start:640 stop:1272 length:633 start_codon:yes stop_codon:yes gene_type:complete